MIATLQAPPSFVGVPDAPAPVREPRPLLHNAGAARPASAKPRRAPASLWPPGGDARANQVLNVYWRAGGLVSGDQLTLLLRRRTSQPISMLARWIVDRRAVSFAWQGDHLLPMFQFDQADLTVRRPVSAVLDEFDGTFDDWELATWFALPNAWLGDEAPVDMLERDAQAVLDAARADRFIARG